MNTSSYSPIALGTYNRCKVEFVLKKNDKTSIQRRVWRNFIQRDWVVPTLDHLSWRLTRWAYRMGLEPASVRPCVRASTLSNMNISETSRPITIKFYLKHHWDGGKTALGFGADQIRTLVSMATDSSYKVIMGKRASSRFLGCFWSDPFYTCRELWHT